MNVPNEFEEFFQGIDLTKREIAFLIWLTEWDQNTIRNMRTVLEKVEDTPRCEDYSRTWLAYRRPSEGEEEKT